MITKLTSIVIIFEGFIIFLIIVVAYIIRSIFLLQQRKKDQIKNKIESYLNTALLNFTEGYPIRFPRRWRKIDIILPIIQKYDQLELSDSWKKLRMALIHKILLPLARENATSSFRSMRILSSQCFCLALGEQDVPVVSRLLQEKIPIIYFHAAKAAVNSGDESLINQVIDKMTPVRRLGQTIFLNLFNGAAPQIASIIEARLAKETNPYVKAICYKLLMTFPKCPLRTVFSLFYDLHSHNIELQLSSMRYMAYNQKKQSIPYLLKQSEDARWEVRATACRLLGEIGAKKAVDVLDRCLKDKIWNVRINAATALKNIGEEGVSKLQAQNPQIDRYAYEAAISVLHQPVITDFDVIK